MGAFIFVGLAMSLTLGVIISMTVFGNAQSWLKILIALGVGFIAAFVIFLSQEAERDIWNSGFCSCGGQWKLVSIDHVRPAGEYYYYECDNCGEVIKLSGNLR